MPRGEPASKKAKHTDSPGTTLAVEAASEEEHKIFEAAISFFGGDVSSKPLDLKHHLEEATKGVKANHGHYAAFGTTAATRKELIANVTEKFERFKMTNIVCRADSAIVRETKCALKFWCGFNVLEGKGAIVIPMCWVCDCDVSGDKVEVKKLEWIADLKEMEGQAHLIEVATEGIRKTSILKPGGRRATRGPPHADEMVHFITDMFQCYYDGHSKLEEQLSFVPDHFADEGAFFGPGDVHEKTAKAYHEKRMAAFADSQASNIAASVENVLVSGSQALVTAWIVTNFPDVGLALRQGCILIEVDEKRKITRWEETIYARTPSTAVF